MPVDQTVYPSPHTSSASPKECDLGNPQDGTLECRVEAVLNSICKSGFNGLEDFVIQYFTADFHEDSSIVPAQSLSRSRHLRELLAAMSSSSQSWSSREAQGFRDEIIRSAELIYTQELQPLAQDVRTKPAASPRIDARNNISEVLRDLMASLDLNGTQPLAKKAVQRKVSFHRRRDRLT